MKYESCFVFHDLIPENCFAFFPVSNCNKKCSNRIFSYKNEKRTSIKTTPFYNPLFNKLVQMIYKINPH